MKKNNDKVVSLQYKKYQKETGRDHIPTYDEVSKRIDEIENKLDEVDHMIARVIDDIDERNDMIDADGSWKFNLFCKWSIITTKQNEIIEELRERI